MLTPCCHLDTTQSKCHTAAGCHDLQLHCYQGAVGLTVQLCGPCRRLQHLQHCNVAGHADQGKTLIGMNLLADQLIRSFSLTTAIIDRRAPQLAPGSGLKLHGLSEPASSLESSTNLTVDHCVNHEPRMCCRPSQLKPDNHGLLRLQKLHGHET